MGKETTSRYYRKKTRHLKKHYNGAMRAINRAMIQDLKIECAMCGSIDDLTFHHKDPATKEWNVGQLVNIGATWNQILKEADKCIVLCLKCHNDFHKKSDSEIESIAANMVFVENGIFHMSNCTKYEYGILETRNNVRRRGYKPCKYCKSNYDVS